MCSVLYSFLLREIKGISSTFRWLIIQLRKQRVFVCLFHLLFSRPKLVNNYMHSGLYVRAMRVEEGDVIKPDTSAKERISYSVSEHLTMVQKYPPYMYRILNTWSPLCQSRKLQRGKIMVLKSLLSSWNHFRLCWEVGRAHAINKPVANERTNEHHGWKDRTG